MEDGIPPLLFFWVPALMRIFFVDDAICSTGKHMMRDIELEIFESGCSMHKVGQKFRYPSETGKMCGWLLDSASHMIRVLECGGKLDWSYKGTPYEKLIDKDGVTTEFVRCPDPRPSGVVLKITATETKRNKSP